MKNVRIINFSCFIQLSAPDVTLTGNILWIYINIARFEFRRNYLLSWHSVKYTWNARCIRLFTEPNKRITMSVINITTYLVATFFDVKTKTFLAINSRLNIARSCFPKTLDVPNFDALHIEINIYIEIKEIYSLEILSMAEHLQTSRHDSVDFCFPISFFFIL